MANYPFKINIQTKNGTQLSYYSSSFATSADTNVSASSIVDSINALPRVQYTQSEAVPNSLSGNYSTAGATGGKTYLSASHNGPQSGSITFTDTEDSATNGGLDFYTFWGTKVCSVLGLPEGIPIYTENFKFSDDETDTTNYISGDVIADGITVKEGFKLSTQARVRGNLIFDDVFGEGFVQFVSGSVTKMTVGYNDDKDFYKIGGSTDVQISGSSANITSAKITSIDNNGGSITNVDLIKSDGASEGIIISGQTDSYDETTFTRGQLKLSGNFGSGTSTDKINKIIGQTEILRSDTSVWHYSSGLTSRQTTYDYNLLLRNVATNTENAFAGVAFQVEDSLNSDAINGAIAVLRDNNTSNKFDGNMIFATNDDADDDLTERMRIHHDGGVKIHLGLGVGTDGPTTAGLIRATNDVVAYYSSDKRLKDNLIKIGNPLDKISQLNGYEFDWIAKEGIHENEGHDVGVIAQEVEKVLPEVVQTRESGYKAVKYEKIVPLLIESIKELKQRVEELENGSN